jgi:SulP family sulfate permease
MFFGATAALEAHFASIEERIGEDTRVVVLRVKRARSPDAVGLTLLESFLERVKTRGVHVLLCGVRADFAEKLDRTGISAHLGERLFLEQPVRQTSTLLAIRHAYELVGSDTCPACPRRGGRASGTELHYHI